MFTEKSQPIRAETRRYEWAACCCRSWRASLYTAEHDSRSLHNIIPLEAEEKQEIHSKCMKQSKRATMDGKRYEKRKSFADTDVTSFSRNERINDQITETKAHSSLSKLGQATPAEFFWAPCSYHSLGGPSPCHCHRTETTCWVKEACRSPENYLAGDNYWK